jgi:hypothetical protein
MIFHPRRDIRALRSRLQVVGAAHTRKPFEKGLIQNLQS